MFLNSSGAITDFFIELHEFKENTLRVNNAGLNQSSGAIELHECKDIISTCLVVKENTLRVNNAGLNKLYHNSSGTITVMPQLPLPSPNLTSTFNYYTWVNRKLRLNTILTTPSHNCMLYNVQYIRVYIHKLHGKKNIFCITYIIYIHIYIPHKFC